MTGVHAWSIDHVAFDDVRSWDGNELIRQTKTYGAIQAWGDSSDVVGKSENAIDDEDSCQGRVRLFLREQGGPTEWGA